MIEYFQCTSNIRLFFFVTVQGVEIRARARVRILITHKCEYFDFLIDVEA